MKKTLLTISAILTAILSFAQGAEELNKESKDFLNKQDFKNAVPLIKSAAEKGSAEAQYNYGICFQQGIEMMKSDSMANTWFLKAANQGWKNAQFKMAYNYATGCGVTKNASQAFNWSVKCAEQQDVECMFNVVTCYMNGNGTIKNIDSVLAWATRIAILENPEDLNVSGQITSARGNLSLMYFEGKHIPKDLAKSYMWFLIYNESKRDLSIAVQQQNINTIQVLEKELSQAERDKAIIDAEKLLNRKLANVSNLHKTEF